MMFRRPETSGMRPAPLKRTLTPKKAKLRIQTLDAYALVISIDKFILETNQLCVFCAHGNNPMAKCEKDFKNIHEEADMIEQVYRRFDYDVVQVKDPTHHELIDIFKATKEKLTGTDKAFFFAYVGHGF